MIFPHSGSPKLYPLPYSMDPEYPEYYLCTGLPPEKTKENNDGWSYYVSVLDTSFSMSGES
jgi:hypothetical protein